MKRIISILPIIMLTALFFTSCEKEKKNVSFTFNATLEQLSSESKSDRKVFLRNEEWIYWEVGDVISVASDKEGFNNEHTATLVRINSNPYMEDFHEFNGIFVATYLPSESKYFLGLFPHNKHNVISPAGAENNNFAAQIYLPDTQTYRTDAVGDSSFARNQFPMVAWYGGEWTSDATAFNLDFHALAGIVRFQVFSGEAKTLDRIEVSCADKQLKGLFTVKDYKTADPHLTSASGDAADKMVTISCSGLSLPTNDCQVFYLILPAMAGMNSTTNYTLTVDVIATDGYHAKKTLTVPVRRTGITYVPALRIDTWTSGSDAGMASVGIVGEGTAERPYKIYSVNDLKYVRDRFAFGGTVTINNLPVTDDSYFRIMRSDIVLNNSNWNAGIENFRGHMTYYGSASSNPGITNESNSPIFASIAANATVQGITVRRNGSTSPNTDYSPFCGINNGSIIGCEVDNVNSSGNLRITPSATHGLAGLCVTNNGTIQGCGSQAKMSNSNGPVAGICLTNNGTITGCFATSKMSVTGGTQASGIVNNNASGTVKDCYFASFITSSTIPWGGIVYTNAGTIEHCYISNTASIQTTSSVGGIVNTITGGKVDYCWSLAISLKGVRVGGIANLVNGGDIINCFCNSEYISISRMASTNPQNESGGIAARIENGSIKNSFVHMKHFINLDADGNTGGIVGVADGGTIDNCYFYHGSDNTLKFVNLVSGSTTITNCYIVEGPGMTPSYGVTACAFTNISTVLSSLNTNVPAGGKTWVASGGTPNIPILSAYSSSKKNSRSK